MPDGRFDHLAYCGFVGLAQSVELMYNIKPIQQNPLTRMQLNLVLHQ